MTPIHKLVLSMLFVFSITTILLSSQAQGVDKLNQVVNTISGNTGKVTIINDFLFGQKLEIYWISSAKAGNGGICKKETLIDDGTATENGKAMYQFTEEELKGEKVLLAIAKFPKRVPLTQLKGVPVTELDEENDDTVSSDGTPEPIPTMKKAKIIFQFMKQAPIAKWKKVLLPELKSKDPDPSVNEEDDNWLVGLKRFSSQVENKEWMNGYVEKLRTNAPKLTFIEEKEEPQEFPLSRMVRIGAVRINARHDQTIYVSEIFKFSRESWADKYKVIAGLDLFMKGIHPCCKTIDELVDFIKKGSESINNEPAIKSASFTDIDRQWEDTEVNMEEVLKSCFDE